MKRFFSIILAVAMVLSLCACAKSAESGQDAPQETQQTPEAQTTPETSLLVGFGRENITPSYSVPLAGYGNTSQRMSDGFLSYIYATCIAVTDANDSTVLLITTDVIAVSNNHVESLKVAVKEATGVPEDRIFIQGTHTHSGPDIWSGESAMGKYIPEYMAGIAKAAANAMADRSPATMETGRGYTEGLNFVRHYTTSAGTLYGDNITLPNGATVTGHTSDPDNEIQLICFKREAADKKDILAVNWQAHVKLDSSGETAEGQANRPMLSADYVGVARDYVEANTDCLFAFYLGAAGNLNPNSKITTENVTTDCKVFGKALGEDILEGMQTLAPTESGEVKAVQKTVLIPIDHSEDELATDAAKVYNYWRDTNDYAGAMKLAVGTPIQSPYHAMSIVSRANNTSAGRNIEMNAIQVGTIGFITAPYEMFDVNGMAIKDASPYETTFIMTCSNGHHDYIAAAYAFENGGSYEVHNRVFAKGTAEDLQDQYIAMLNELKN